MKRLLILLFTVVLYGSFSIAQQQKTDQEKVLQNGKIKSIRETTYSISNNVGIKTNEIVVADKYIIFDREGNKQRGLAPYKSDYLHLLFKYTTNCS